MIDLFPNDRSTQGLMAITLNTDLSIDRSKMFNFNTFNPLGPTSINSANTIGYCWSYAKDTSLLYAQIDEDLNILYQKKIKLSSYPVSNYFGQPVFRKNGTVDIQVLSIGSNGLNNFLQLENTSAYNVNNNCLGNDTGFLSPAEVTILPLKIQLDTSSDLPLSVEDVPVLSSEDRNMPEQLYCKQVSICDTIKIKGSSQYCSTDSVAQFTLYKNSRCLRRTVWDADTTALKIVSIPNDTTLNIKFLKPYSGYIYAGFAGCQLKDSLKINVVQAKQNFAINKDSIICPGKNIVLQASTGFQTYQWQDGSSLASYVATAAGFYKVMATDSCGKMFSDSIAIKKADTSFALPPYYSICPYDTVFIKVPDGIMDVSLQPFAGGMQRNNQLLLYPVSTTTYNIQGTAGGLCNITKSITIIIKDCPDYIYFPNAFTPNGNGLNEFFRPYTASKFESYTLKIFNRWGQLIFESNNPKTGWDGKFKGAWQSTDSYVYICKYQIKNQPAKQTKGYVTLLK